MTLMNQKYDLFISHNVADRVWAKHLAQQIEGDTFGPPLHVFMDTLDLRPGTNFPRLLAQAIDQSRRIAFVLSPESVQSEWVRMEMAVAIARRDPSGTKGVLVPLLRRDCEIPVELSHLSYIDFRRREYHDGLRRLVDLLRDRNPDRGPGSADNVRRLAEDCELIAAHRTFFDRPAFWRGCIFELSLTDLSEAIDDTVAALNTGALQSRKGRILVRAPSQGRYQTEEFVTVMTRISEHFADLQRVLRDVRIWFDRTLGGYTSDYDCSSMWSELLAAGRREDADKMLRYMDEIDARRNVIIGEVNAWLRIADERALPVITLSSSSPLASS